MSKTKDKAAIDSATWRSAKVCFTPVICDLCGAPGTRALITGWITDEGDLVTSIDEALVIQHSATCSL